MNQRIYELANRAGEYTDFEFGICTDEFLEKFAEFIVKECIDISYTEGDNVAYLALHFGVE